MNSNRESIKFKNHQPVIVRLIDDPENARFQEARFQSQEDTWRMWCDGNLTLWAPELLKRKLQAAGAIPGEPISITKDGSNWHVQRISEEAACAAQELGRMEQPRPVSQPRVLPKRPPAPRVSEEKFYQPGQAAVMMSDPRVERMAAALQAAMEACKKSGFAAGPEDVRAIAITMFIEAGKGQRAA